MVAAPCSRTRVHVVDDGRLTIAHAHRGPALRDESGPAWFFLLFVDALTRGSSRMYGSRSTTLALTIALGAITLGRPMTASAQTTIPTPPTATADTASATKAVSTVTAGGVTQQALDQAALARIKELEDRIATLEKAEAKAKAAAAAAPTVTATRDGLNVRSADTA
mgnify:CR=1 FL=1